MSAGEANLIKCDEESRKSVLETVSEGGVDSSSTKWRKGELQFEAYMRMLDSMVRQLGYVYRVPQENDVICFFFLLCKAHSKK